MPTHVLLQHEGLEPPHVHIQRERSLAKFWLQPITIALATNFSAGELRQLERLVTENQQSWMEAWHEFFSRRNSPDGS
jgi:hypothetical protein